MNRFKLALAAPCLVACLLSGCASVTSGKFQPLSVAAVKGGEDVDNAKCALTNDKGTWYANTPGSVMVQKSYGDLVVVCKKTGYKPGTLSVKSASNGGVWGNIIAGGLIGYAVDASSGAGFDYPTNLTVSMGKNITLAPQQAPAATGQKKTTND